ncbi:MAG: exonuclease [Pseudomonadota bacterium]
MDRIVVYDAEFLTAPGAPQRFWCGPSDPDPLTIQIGAAALDLNNLTISPAENWYVRPVDRDGHTVAVDPLVTRLTGISDAELAQHGVPLPEALGGLRDFAGGVPILAWGKDELLTFAASLFVQDILSPIPAAQFRTAVPLLVAAGEPEEVVQTLRSHTICAHFDLPQPGPAHDARGDAMAVAHVLRHLLQTHRLDVADIQALCYPNTAPRQS